MDETIRSEINDISPSSLSHLIGQRSVIDQVSVALEAAFADKKRMDSALLVGPPGVGKSALAGVIAQEMASNFHEVLGQSINGICEMNTLLLTAREKDVVHIDEAHELDKELQTALYLALDKKQIFVKGGRAILGLPISDFTLLLSTTDEYCLLQPLRDRMKLTLRFDFYSAGELTTVLKYRSRGLQWSVAEEVLPLIAQRSRGTPRLALRLLQSCRRVCRAGNETSITVAHLEKACALEQIDDLGLGPTEQNYLKVLAEGPVRLNLIASRLGLPARTVSLVNEPFLIRAGMVTKDDQGRRQLTAQGQERASKICPTGV